MQAKDGQCYGHMQLQLLVCFRIRLLFRHVVVNIGNQDVSDLVFHYQTTTNAFIAMAMKMRGAQRLAVRQIRSWLWT